MPLMSLIFSQSCQPIMILPGCYKPICDYQDYDNLNI